MARNIVGRCGVFVGLGLFLVACGSSKKTTNTKGLEGDGGSGATFCVAGSKRCDGQSIKRCDDAGANETVERTCATGLRCRAEGDDAECDTVACAANQPLCDGSIATTCKADGSGPKPGGVDCADANQSCADGKCRELICERGEKFCLDNDVHLCDPNGKASSLLLECAAGEVCDAELAACRPKICEPGKSTCSGTVAKICDLSGSGFLPGSVDCAADGKSCIAGSCAMQTCEPVRRYCQDGDIYQCDADGKTMTLSQNCDDDEHCEARGGGYAFCYANACEPGQKLCVGNVIKTCNDEHYLPDDGTACGADAWCEGGECKPRSCTPDTLFCQDSDVYYCQETAPPSLYVDCGLETACKVLFPPSNPNAFSGASCAPSACSPGTSACFLNQLGTCGPDGESLSAVTGDCTTYGDVCTIAGNCAKSATDTLGLDESAEVLSGGIFYGNLIEVRSARKLTELQTWVVFPSPRQVRWLVYEQSASSFIAKVDKLVTVASSTGLVSSGAGSFDYQLQVGKRYALGVVVSGDAVGAYDTAPFPSNSSFGIVLGRMLASYPGNFDGGQNFTSDVVTHMQVVTAAP